MRYDTNTKSIEPGTYVFQIAGYPQSVMAGAYEKVEFIFSSENMEKPIKMSFFPNQMKGLLVALGFKEVEGEPGVFDCDISAAYGKFVRAELYMEEYLKADKVTKGQARKLRNFEAMFDSNGQPLSPADIAWEE